MHTNDDNKLNFSTFASRMLAQSNFLSRPGDDDSPLFYPEHDMNDVDADNAANSGGPGIAQPRRSAPSGPSRIASAFSAVANRHPADNNDSDDDDDSTSGNKNNASGGSELLLGSRFYHDDSAAATVDPFVLDSHHNGTGNNNNDNNGHQNIDDTDPFIPAPIQGAPTTGANPNTGDQPAPGWKMHQTTTMSQSNIDSQDPFLTSSSHDPSVSSSQYPPPPRAHSPLRLESSYRRLDSSDYQQPVGPQKFRHVFFRSSNNNPLKSQTDSLDPRQVPLLSDSGPFPSSSSGPSSAGAGLRYPRPSIATSLQGHSYHKLRTRDSTFASVFLISSFILILIAVWSSLVPPPLPDLFVLSIPHLTLITFLSFLIGCSYTLILFLLKTGAAKSTLYISIAFPPISLLLASLYAFSMSWNIQSSSIAKGLRWTSCLSFLFSVFLAVSASKNFARVKQTGQVLELACEIILANPALILLSFALSLLFLIGSLLLALLVLTLSHWHPVYSVFVSFHGLWLLAVLRGLFRLIVSGVVGDWFFNRHEPSATSTSAPEQQQKQQPSQIFRSAVTRATGPSFGTAVISGILLTLVDTTTYALAQLFKIKTRVASSSRLLSTILLPVFWVCTPVLLLFEAYLDTFNTYVLIFAGLSGDGFWESTRAVAGLIRSSGSQIISERLLVKRILNLVAFVISAVSSLTVFVSLYTQSTSTTPSNHFVPITSKDIPDMIIILIFAGMLPFWMIRLSSDLLANTTDTLFISHAIDLTSGTTHSAKAAQAFGVPETISTLADEDDLPI